MSANQSSIRPTHSLFIIVGDDPEDVEPIHIGTAAPSADGHGFILRMEATFAVEAEPTLPISIF